MDLRDYCALDATALADLIRSRQVSAAQVEAVARSAIEAVNPRLNAIVGSLFDKPLDANSSGRFAGVPFVVKDLVAHAAGVPYEVGSRLARGLVMPHDTALMAKFRGAGLSILGRTNTPEFGINASTEPVANGPTRNPWDVTRSSGGSSGGSAALVAAGAVPFAHANDGGGSIRVPAANCGLVGLKPTRGRVAIGPDADNPIGGCGIEFAVTRTVRDAAALLDQVQGPAPGELFWIGAPERPYVQELGADPGRLRIAVSSVPPSGVPVDSESLVALEQVAKVLEGMGHEIRPEAPPVPFAAFDHAIVVYFTTFGAKGVTDLAAALGRPISLDTVEATTLACLEHAKKLTALDVMNADGNRNLVNRTVGAWFETVDLLVTPTCARPAWPLGHLNANDPSIGAQGWFDKVFAEVPFTALFNLTGQPAVSLPLAQSKGGLPIGIQLVARYGREDVLFRVAHRLEEALPWKDRRPAIYAA
ncbi:MAG: amidase family protein [Gemmatimonadota bacterium]